MKHYLSVSCIFKHEAPYLGERLRSYSPICVEHQSLALLAPLASLALKTTSLAAARISAEPGLRVSVVNFSPSR